MVTKLLTDHVGGGEDRVTQILTPLVLTLLLFLRKGEVLTQLQRA